MTRIWTGAHLKLPRARDLWSAAFSSQQYMNENCMIWYY